MAFRILVIGVAGHGDYRRLRDALDFLLRRRLPDVEILTAGGPGLPAFAACYARARGLRLTVITPDHEKHPGDAVDKRNTLLVAESHAAVVMADQMHHPETDRLVQLMRAKGARVATIFAKRQLLKAEPVHKQQHWGLPD